MHKLAVLVIAAASIATAAGQESPKHPLLQQYEDTLAVAAKTRDERLTKIDTAYNASLATAEAELRKTFEPLFRNAKPAEAKTYTDTMEKLLSTATPAKADAEGNPASAIRLTGKWVPREFNVRNAPYHWLFDFGDGKEMTLVYTYTSAFDIHNKPAHSKAITRNQYKLETKDGKIILSPLSQRASSLPGASSSSDHSFEIPTPFDPARPAMKLTTPQSIVNIQLERVQ